MSFELSMVIIFVIFLLVIVGVLVYVLSMIKRHISDKIDAQEEVSEYKLSLEELLIDTKQVTRIVLILAAILGGGLLIYYLIEGTRVQGFVMEWLNLIVRWAHVVVGIMWIGASFYFIFLENNLNRTKGIRDELAGNLWAIHGGGFYFLEKYKVAPGKLPEDLHWFKYEAYFTWITGFSLLTVVYYMDAKSLLIDPQVADIPVWAAVLIGIATIVIGWVVYDALCKSLIVKKPLLFGLVGMVLIGAISYLLLQVFTSRAAYIHIGALIGTLMAGNVYFGIIPAQKALVKAAILNEPLDPTLGQKAGERSLHNNYLTLPVIFIMLSNHFPSTYGHEYNWLILMVIMIASAGVKHYWNLLERGQKTKFILPVSVVALLGLALFTSPVFDTIETDSETVEFRQVHHVIRTRCVQCHSEYPTDDTWDLAPNNVKFDRPDQIKAMADRIMIRAVTTKTMPVNNKTNITDEERELLKNWIIQGANIN